jgi:hypothetical protein
MKKSLPSLPSLAIMSAAAAVTAGLVSTGPRILSGRAY